MAEKKKYDPDIIGWMTRGGKRIPIRKGNYKGTKIGYDNVRNGKDMEGNVKENLKKQVKRNIRPAVSGDDIFGPEVAKSRRKNRQKEKIKSALKKDKDDKREKEKEKKAQDEKRALDEKQIKSVQAQVEKLREKAKKTGDVNEVKSIESKIALLEDKIRSDEGRKTVKQMTQDLIKEANVHADEVTKDLQNAVGDSGSIDTGLPFRVKTEGSLLRKIKMKARAKGISEEEYASKVTDVLRFTDYADEDKLAESFAFTKKNLESKGYEMIECTNTFHLKKAPYRGINTLVKSPKGYVFELQFHTPQSFQIKEENHKMYEEHRLEGTTQERKKELTFLMKKNAMKVKVPKNIESVKNIG